MHCCRIALYLVIKLLGFGHFDDKNDPDSMLQVKSRHKRINSIISNIFLHVTSNGNLSYLSLRLFGLDRKCLPNTCMSRIKPVDRATDKLITKI